MEVNYDDIIATIIQLQVYCASSIDGTDFDEEDTPVEQIYDVIHFIGLQ